MHLGMLRPVPTDGSWTRSVGLHEESSRETVSSDEETGVMEGSEDEISTLHFRETGQSKKWRLAR